MPEENFNRAKNVHRVAIHQAVDEIVDARRRVYGLSDATNEALSDALDHLSAVALDGHPYTVESAWQAVAAIAQAQLEQTLEDRVA